MITYCDNCDDTETLEDGFTCKKCGYVPCSEWGTVNNLYSGLDDSEPEPKPKIGFISRLYTKIKSYFPRFV